MKNNKSKSKRKRETSTDLQARLSDEEECPRIVPSIDYLDGIGYCFVPVRGKSSDESGDFHVVSSNREIFNCSEEELETRKIALITSPAYTRTRWSKRDIAEFLDGNDIPDKAKIYNTVRSIYDSYLEFSNETLVDVLSLFTIGTYLHRRFESFPYLHLSGEMGSGKTKTLTIAEHLCFNAINISHITPAVLFRLVHGSSCTLLIDEAERLSNIRYAGDLMSLLNSGYKKGSQVLRLNLKTKGVDFYELYSPKIVANIRGLEKVLAGRCISIPLYKATEIDKANRTVSEKSENWALIRHHLYCLALTCSGRIRKYYDCEIDDSKNTIRARDSELWFPILAIARFFDNNGCSELYDKIKTCAREYIKETRMDVLDDWTIDLIYAIAYIVLIENQEDNISIETIRQQMSTYTPTGRQYYRFKVFRRAAEPCGPSDRWIGSKLKILGLIKRRKRLSTGWQYNITSDRAFKVLKRYDLVDDFEGMHNTSITMWQEEPQK